MAKKETKEKDLPKKSKTKPEDGFVPNDTKKEDDLTITNFFTDGRFSKILGLFLIMSSAFLGIAFFSYLSTWKNDQSNVFKFNWHLLMAAKDVVIENKLGRLGAIISHQFFFNGPGIASFAFVILAFTLGFNLLARKKVFPVIKIAQFTIFSIVWIAAACSFVFSKNPFPYGGAMGDAINFWTNGFVGTIGTALNLIITFFIFLTVIYNLDYNFKIPTLSNSLQFKKNNSLEAEAESFAIDNSLKNEAEAIFDDVKTSQQIINTDVKEEVEEDDDDLLDSTYLNTEPLFKPNSGNVQFELNEINTEKTIQPITDNSTKNIAPNNPELEIEETFTPTTPPLPIAMDVAAPIVETLGEQHDKIATVTKYDPTLDLSHYQYPTLDLLQDYGMESTSVTKDELEQNKNQIVTTLRNYGIEIDKIKATIGPTVTLYEIVPAAGVRISKIKNLEDDIALSLSALGIRIIAPIPGKGTIGIEVPNIKKELVSMRNLLSSEKFQNAQMDLPIALGKNIANENIIVDLAKMPHVLVAGATGQGKSVGLNAILVSLLYKKHPSQLKFVMVDPKKVELSIYKTIEKHFLAKMPYEDDPIITDVKKVVATLNSLCIEMDRRYDLLKDATCRNLKEYNQKFIDRRLNPTKGHEFLPFIVVVIDEFADLIMTAGKEVEMPIARIAQLARAVGIHLIL
ncbi:MAG: hypothetical protein RIQ33_866, partial [Bacteroidota bacterium]